jgi:hypothetical protein
LLTSACQARVVDGHIGGVDGLKHGDLERGWKKGMGGGGMKVVGWVLKRFKL